MPALLYARLKPSVTYVQFRNWLKEDEPVCPTRENLEQLLSQLGFGRELAELVYAAALDHRADRHAVYDHLLNLSRKRLDVIYLETDGSDLADPDQGITIEDLQAVIQFEKVTGVDLDHAS